MNNRIWFFILVLFLVVSCGGGGGGYSAPSSNNSNTTPALANLNISNDCKKAWYTTTFPTATDSDTVFNNYKFFWQSISLDAMPICINKYEATDAITSTGGKAWDLYVEEIAEYSKYTLGQIVPINIFILGATPIENVTDAEKTTYNTDFQTVQARVGASYSTDLSNGNIFPIDSEHFSVYEYFTNLNSLKNFNNIILTASGGPFLYKKYNTLKNVTFSKATKHPKWKMGYKNSIDSATLVNKCLEIIEVHYLFNIPFDKIKIIIHPEALVHSIIEKNNYVTNLNLFKNDMNIPINNFLRLSNMHTLNKLDELSLSNYSQLKFNEVNYDIFPIYKYFNNMDLYDPSLLIRFNVGNEYAVNLFKKKLIKYKKILKIIKKVCSLDLKYRLNTIKDIIKYHEDLEKLIKIKFNYNT